MIVIGNNELKTQPILGNTIRCPRCNRNHRLKYGEEVLADGTRRPSRLLAFFTCRGKTYLGGIAGHECRPRKEQKP